MHTNSTVESLGLFQLLQFHPVTIRSLIFSFVINIIRFFVIRVYKFFYATKMLTDNQRIYIVENYFTTNSYQQIISLFKCKFPSVLTPNKVSIACMVKKFCKEGTVKNFTHQRHHPILIPTKMSEIRATFSTTPQTMVRKVSTQVKISRSLPHWATRHMKLYLYFNRTKL